MEGRPGLISVQTEVAKEVLVGSLFEAAEERVRAGLPEQAAAALARALDALQAAGCAELPSNGAAAARVAHLGYAARDAERERFTRAREPIGWLVEELHGSEPVELAARLAADEPLERPRPDDARAASWRVPGPGGHIRHYIALRAAGGDLTLKRAWLYGFFLRCCEETPAAG